VKKRVRGKGFAGSGVEGGEASYSPPERIIRGRLGDLTFLVETSHTVTRTQGRERGVRRREGQGSIETKVIIRKAQEIVVCCAVKLHDSCFGGIIRSKE